MVSRFSRALDSEMIGLQMWATGRTMMKNLLNFIASELRCVKWKEERGSRLLNMNGNLIARAKSRRIPPHIFSIFQRRL